MIVYIYNMMVSGCMGWVKDFGGLPWNRNLPGDGLRKVPTIKSNWAATNKTRSSFCTLVTHSMPTNETANNTTRVTEPINLMSGYLPPIIPSKSSTYCDIISRKLSQNLVMVECVSFWIKQQYRVNNHPIHSEWNWHASYPIMYIDTPIEFATVNIKPENW